MTDDCSNSMLASAFLEKKGAASLQAVLEHVRLLAPLLDVIPDIAFFIKDTELRYVFVNRSFAARLGIKDQQQLIGRTTKNLFPSPLGETYAEQDRSIIASSSLIFDRLELHLYPGRQSGWCITTKIPIRGMDGKALGLAGMSRDLHAIEKTHPAYGRLAAVVQHIRDHFSSHVSLQELATIANMSIAQLERYFHKIFYLTPRQMLLRTRLENATTLLAEGDKVTDIAAACGYADHSSFTRQFKASVGVTPTDYRAMLSASPVLGSSRSA
jgi:AraC-like DNA-binding protein